MKYNSFRLANALAFASSIFFVACRVLVGLLPNEMFLVAQSWFHGVGLVKLESVDITTQTFLVGLVSLAATAWIFGYLVGLGLEIFRKKK